jgi:hypothetical protein
VNVTLAVVDMPCPSPVNLASLRSLAALACLVAAPVHADVYKCAGPDGVPIYQESPCPKGTQLRDFQADPPQLSVVPGGGALDPGVVRAPRSDERSGGNGKTAKAAKSTSIPSGGKADPAERRHLRSGMTEGEVLARVGSPDITSGSKATQSGRWSYLPTDGDPDTITTLTFADGKVTKVERKLAKK